MRSWWAGVWVGTLLLALAGCRSKDRVENELRARDNQFREAVEELGKSEAYNHSLQREIEELRKGAPVTPEQAAQTFGLKRIVIGRGTGGYDNDSLPGDEGLQVIIEPRDQDDHTIKAPGTLQIMVLEITQQGIKAPLDGWTIEPHKLQKSWKQGLLSTGYSLVMPWKNFPRTENLRVVARLVLTDGRVYEADKDIKVKLVPGVRGSDGPPVCPPENLDPFMFPAGKPNTSDKSKVTPASHDRPDNRQSTPTRWEPVPDSRRESAPPGEAIRLGRPTSLSDPGAPPSN